ncbi:MAG: hypothetical protein IT289_12240 [Oligoflexia bacterium]|nr:hypothetical protein [Oligoflexia bacterium]
MTQDGSPTLRLLRSGECMHSISGAVSETLYILQPGFDWLVSQNLPIRLCSVGLGIGYVELGTMALFGREISRINSFETEGPLISGFQDWLNGCESDFYDEVLNHVSQSSGVQAESIRDRAAKTIGAGKWNFKGSILNEAPDELCNMISFDPYSGKSSPELWTEESLSSFIKRHCAPESIWVTYSSKPLLREVLQSHGFHCVLRQGYGLKKESLLAIRST